LEQVTEHFAGRCRQVVTVPFDAHLEAGTKTSVEDLRPATRQAYLRLAAAVADGFDRPSGGQHRTERERLTR
jgi:MinD-like ATPase involved in chromosome partitioning or flagellar assembly